MIHKETKKQLQDLRLGNPPAESASIFGADISSEEAQLVLLGVPFEATTSYGGGTAEAPSQIVRASHQLDLFDPDYGNTYLSGIHYEELSDLKPVNKEGKSSAQSVIQQLENQQQPDQELIRKVNQSSYQVNDKVYQAAKSHLANGKFIGLVGGDHSCPFGLIKALGEVHEEFGILHIDAHHDLREAYEGFEHSHASIMYNVLAEVKQVTKLHSVGIRDYSEEEYKLAKVDDRIHTLYDHDFQRAKMGGRTVLNSFHELLEDLPQKIYVSFDIDGLDPSLSPSTGTPVPGGLNFSEACFLLNMLRERNKEVIGFDLCEVVPGVESEWDMNVGARVLYKLCGLLSTTQNLKSLLEGE